MDSKNQLNQKQTPTLPIHEWVIVLLFCLILLVLAGFAIGRSKSSPPRAAPFPILEEVTVLLVKIEGEVVNPGLYRLPLHATIKDLLEQAEPLFSADLSQLNWRRRLRNNQTIRIPKRSHITIYLKGAVQEPGFFKILSGTRYCEVVEQLSVLPGADLKFLRKKRSFVQEGVCIEIPFEKKDFNLKKQRTQMRKIQKIK